jgi:2-isopropylmalate synthase
LGDAFHLYDTTLRDGAQAEGVTYSVPDKLAVARLLDELGVGFIEGGWPGAMPKDTEFFARAATELSLQHAVLVAFGATRKPGIAAGADRQVRALLDSAAPVITLVAKSDRRHVERGPAHRRRREPRHGRRHGGPAGGRASAGVRGP